MANTGGGNVLNAVLVFGGDAKSAIKAINSLSKALTDVDKKVKKVDTKSLGERLSKSLDLARNSMNRFGKSMQQTFDGLRLVAQGVMSIGRALTFFVSIPLAAFLGGAFKGAMEFEDALVRVAKTTGLSSSATAKYEDSLSELTLRLREIARRAPTTHEELAAMAEQAGQLGVQGVTAISEFVEWMDIFSTSTNIAGDDVVVTMGKISNAFGWNLNESREQVIRLANVMNTLENNTAATAQEIADALYRFAPVAETLNMSAADAAALSAALISLGVSAESAGTRLSTMYVKLTQNADKFAEIAAGTEKYATKENVLAALGDDPVQVLYDLMVMLEETDGRAEKLAEEFELVGLRGGRALSPMAANTKQTADAIGLAREEWGKAASLLIEYNRALESSQNQMKILKNNVKDLAIEVGNTLLPVFNDIFQLLIPPIRAAIKWIAQLDKKWILLGLAVAAFLVVLGPVMFFVSQIVFGFFMLGLGIFKIVAAVGSLIMGIGSLLGAFASLGPAALVVIGIFVAIIGYLKKFTGVGDQIASFFKNLANSAKTWGENLTKNLAGGFVSGAVKFITKAIEWVANLIASFFESHSPPDVGPLAHIDKWGQALIDTYLGSMKNADFEILENVSSIMEGIFKNFEVSGIVGEDAQFTLLMQAREDLAELFAVFRKTGEFSDEILQQIVANLGSASDEVEKLIRLQFDLMRIEEELAAIEKKRRDVNRKFSSDATKAALDESMTVEERVESVRELMYGRDQELRSLYDQEQALEEQKDEAEDLLETHEAMIKAMQKQDDLQASLIKAMEKLADAAGGGDEGGFQLPNVDVPNLGEMIEEAIGELGNPLIEFEAKISSKSGIWEMVQDILLGNPVPDLPTGALLQFYGVSPEDEELFLTLKGVAEDIKGFWDRTQEKVQGVLETIRQIGVDLGLLTDEEHDIEITVNGKKPGTSIGEVLGAVFNLSPASILGDLDSSELTSTISEWWAGIDWPELNIDLAAGWEESKQNIITDAENFRAGIISGLQPATDFFTLLFGGDIEPGSDLEQRLQTQWNGIFAHGFTVEGILEGIRENALNPADLEDGILGWLEDRVFKGMQIANDVGELIWQAIFGDPNKTEYSQDAIDRVAQFTGGLITEGMTWDSFKDVLDEKTKGLAGKVINWFSGLFSREGTTNTLPGDRSFDWLNFLVGDMHDYSEDDILAAGFNASSIVESIRSLFDGSFAENKTAAQDSLNSWVADVLNIPVSVVSDQGVAGSISTVVSEHIGNFKTEFDSWKSDAIDHVFELFTNVLTIDPSVVLESNVVTSWKTALADLVENVKEYATEKFEAFISFFEGIGASVAEWIADGLYNGVDYVVSKVEGFINNIITSINNVLAKFTNFSIANIDLGSITSWLGGALGRNQEEDTEEAGSSSGGIFVKPVRSWLAERGKAEALIPLERLPALMDQMGYAGAGGDINIKIEVGSVRDDRDIEKIKKAIRDVLKNEVAQARRF